MARVPKRMLVHSFVYSEYRGEDRNHKPVYADPVMVRNCRVDFSTIYSRDKEEKRIVAECLILCYSGQTNPFLTFKEQSKVLAEGRELTIQKIVPVYEPCARRLFSYELECL